jgi:hypothetical protein
VYALLYYMCSVSLIIHAIFLIAGCLIRGGNKTHQEYMEDLEFHIWCKVPFSTQRRYVVRDQDTVLCLLLINNSMQLLMYQPTKGHNWQELGHPGSKQSVKASLPTIPGGRWDLPLDAESSTLWVPVEDPATPFPDRSSWLEHVLLMIT